MRTVSNLCVLAIISASHLILIDAGLAAEPASESIHWPLVNADIPKILDERARAQRTAIARAEAFHDFQFTDRVAESKITFEQRSVDDACKAWKPVHYDHGTAVAVADVDGDGKLDLYFVNQLGANQLWRNRGDGTFEDITARAGVAVAGTIHVAASFADIDNDGDADLFVTTVKMGNVLFENLGDGRFRDITRDAGLEHVGHSSGAVFFDFDRDGLLDLLVLDVGVYTTDQKGPGGFFASATNAFHGHLYPERVERKHLYRNLGGRKFRDVTAEVNLLDTSWSGDATFTDLNEDGWPDLYILNMQGDDHYYENVAGKRFVERTAQYFPKTPWGAMGIKFFDFNQDGRLDLFITDMHSDMTEIQTRKGRTSLDSAFEKEKSEAYCTAFWTDAFLQGASNNIFGNAFYLNQGGGHFTEVSQQIGAETYWPWGISVGDLNADGYEDVFVTAGMGFPFRYAINSILLNDRGTRFVDAEFALGVEPRAGGVDRTNFVFDCAGEDRAHQLCQNRNGPLTVYGSRSSRSSVMVDLDDDGDLDIVTNEMNDRPQVLMSNLAAKHPIHFLKVKLVGMKSNRDGLGATVKVHAGGRTLMQFHDGKSGYLAQSSMPLYFGLGSASKVDRVEVRWPSGRTQNVSENIRPNTLLTVREPAE